MGESEMQVARSMESNDEMVVKSLSVPIGLEELMEGLTKEVLLKRPADIYAFSSEYFSKLLGFREKGCYRGQPPKQVRTVTKKTVNPKAAELAAKRANTRPDSTATKLILTGSNKNVIAKSEVAQNKAAKAKILERRRSRRSLLTEDNTKKQTGKVQVEKKNKMTQKPSVDESEKVEISPRTAQKNIKNVRESSEKRKVRGSRDSSRTKSEAKQEGDKDKKKSAEVTPRRIGKERTDKLKESKEMKTSPKEGTQQKKDARDKAGATEEKRNKKSVNKEDRIGLKKAEDRENVKHSENGEETTKNLISANKKKETAAAKETERKQLETTREEKKNGWEETKAKETLVVPKNLEEKGKLKEAEAGKAEVLTQDAETGETKLADKGKPQDDTKHKELQKKGATTFEEAKEKQDTEKAEKEKVSIKTKKIDNQDAELKLDDQATTSFVSQDASIERNGANTKKKTEKNGILNEEKQKVEAKTSPTLGATFTKPEQSNVRQEVAELETSKPENPKVEAKASNNKGSTDEASRSAANNSKEIKDLSNDTAVDKEHGKTYNEVEKQISKEVIASATIKKIGTEDSEKVKEPTAEIDVADSLTPKHSQSKEKEALQNEILMKAETPSTSSEPKSDAASKDSEESNKTPSGVEGEAKSEAVFKTEFIEDVKKTSLIQEDLNTKAAATDKEVNKNNSEALTLPSVAKEIAKGKEEQNKETIRKVRSIEANNEINNDGTVSTIQEPEHLEILKEQPEGPTTVSSKETVEISQKRAANDQNLNQKSENKDAKQSTELVKLTEEKKDASPNSAQSLMKEAVTKQNEEKVSVQENDKIQQKDGEDTVKEMKDCEEVDKPKFLRSISEYSEPLKSERLDKSKSFDIRAEFPATTPPPTPLPVEKTGIISKIGEATEVVAEKLVSAVSSAEEEKETKADEQEDVKNLETEKEDAKSITNNMLEAERAIATKFDSSKLKQELEEVQKEAKLNSYTNSYNPHLLRQEIKNASVDNTETDDELKNGDVSETRQNTGSAKTAEKKDEKTTETQEEKVENELTKTEAKQKIKDNQENKEAGSGEKEGSTPKSEHENLQKTDIPTKTDESIKAAENKIEEAEKKITKHIGYEAAAKTPEKLNGEIVHKYGLMDKDDELARKAEGSKEIKKDTKMDKEVAAIIKIQSFFRGFMARKKIKLEKKKTSLTTASPTEQEEIVTVKRVAELKTTKQSHDNIGFQKQVAAAMTIQKFWKNIMAKRHEAATKIQANVRGFLVRKTKETEKGSEGKQSTGENADGRSVVLTRSETETREHGTGFQKQVKAALTIQKFWKKIMAKRHEAATKIQANVRGYLVRKAKETEFGTEEKPSISENSEARNAQLTRSETETKEDANGFQKQVRAALTIQKFWKKIMAKKHEAATKIQANVRGYLVRKAKETEEDVKEKLSTSENSDTCSAPLTRKNTQTKENAIGFQKQVRAALTIQKFWKKIMAKRHEAATKIQANVRGYLVRKTRDKGEEELSEEQMKEALQALDKIDIPSESPNMNRKKREVDMPLTRSVTVEEPEVQKKNITPLGMKSRSSGFLFGPSSVMIGSFKTEENDSSEVNKENDGNSSTREEPKVNFKQNKNAKQQDTTMSAEKMQEAQTKLTEKAKEENIILASAIKEGSEEKSVKSEETAKKDKKRTVEDPKNIITETHSVTEKREQKQSPLNKKTDEAKVNEDKQTVAENAKGHEVGTENGRSTRETESKSIIIKANKEYSDISSNPNKQKNECGKTVQNGEDVPLDENQPQKGHTVVGEQKNEKEETLIKPKEADNTSGKNESTKETKAVVVSTADEKQNEVGSIECKKEEIKQSTSETIKHIIDKAAGDLLHDEISSDSTNKQGTKTSEKKEQQLFNEVKEKERENSKTPKLYSSMDETEIKENKKNRNIKASSFDITQLHSEIEKASDLSAEKDVTKTGTTNTIEIPYDEATKVLTREFIENERSFQAFKHKPLDESIDKSSDSNNNAVNDNSSRKLQRSTTFICDDLLEKETPPKTLNLNETEDIQKLSSTSFCGTERLDYEIAKTRPLSSEEDVEMLAKGSNPELNRPLSIDSTTSADSVVTVIPKEDGESKADILVIHQEAKGLEEDMAATKIQAAYRGHRVRRDLKKSDASKTLERIREIEKKEKEIKGNKTEHVAQAKEVTEVVEKQGTPEDVKNQETDKSKKSIQKDAFDQTVEREENVKEDEQMALPPTLGEKQKLKKDQDVLDEQILSIKKELKAATAMVDRNLAAIKIQSTYRGHRVRKDLKNEVLKKIDETPELQTQERSPSQCELSSAVKLEHTGELQDTLLPVLDKTDGAEKSVLEEPKTIPTKLIHTSEMHDTFLPDTIITESSREKAPSEKVSSDSTLPKPGNDMKDKFSEATEPSISENGTKTLEKNNAPETSPSTTTTQKEVLKIDKKTKPLEGTNSSKPVPPDGNIKPNTGTKKSEPSISLKPDKNVVKVDIQPSHSEPLSPPKPGEFKKNNQTDSKNQSIETSDTSKSNIEPESGLAKTLSPPKVETSRINDVTAVQVKSAETLKSEKPEDNKEVTITKSEPSKKETAVTGKEISLLGKSEQPQKDVKTSIKSFPTDAKIDVTTEIKPAFAETTMKVEPDGKSFESLSVVPTDNTTVVERKTAEASKNDAKVNTSAKFSETVVEGDVNTTENTKAGSFDNIIQTTDDKVNAETKAPDTQPRLKREISKSDSKTDAAASQRGAEVDTKLETFTAPTYLNAEDTKATTEPKVSEHLPEAVDKSSEKLVQIPQPLQNDSKMNAETKPSDGSPSVKAEETAATDTEVKPESADPEINIKTSTIANSHEDHKSETTTDAKPESSESALPPKVETSESETKMEENAKPPENSTQPAGQNNIKADVEAESSPPPGLIYSGELQDGAVPLAVRLDQSSGAPELTSSRRRRRLTTHARLSGGDAGVVGSTPEHQSEDGEPPGEMEQKRVNSSIVKNKSVEAEAATKIQASFRGYQVRKQLKQKSTSGDGTKSQQRRQVKRKSSGSLSEALRDPQTRKEIEERSATKIQAGIRGFLVRKRQKNNAKKAPAEAS